MVLDRKIAYIDLSTGEVRTAPIPLEMRYLYLGGRGVDAYLLYNHLRPGVDPLGAENVLLVSAGLLCGTPASASSRGHVAAKSPLTGFLGSANVGGFFAPELRWAGFDHLVIKGKASRPVYIWIHNQEIQIRDASHLWGEDTFNTQQMIREELGDEEIQILCIGPAGEKMVRFSNVRTGLKSGASRTGMGAVFGSKNLKAIAVRGTMDIKIKYPEEALKYNKQVTQQITATKFGRIMQKWGTMFIYSITNSTGLIRCRNFQLNQLFGGDGLDCEQMEKYQIGKTACFGCALHCRHKYIIREGSYAGVYAQGPEYTSQGAFGTEVGCNNIQTVLICNYLVNKYGLDTLETGSMIAWAMELYEKGILTDKDTDGIKLTWGNDEAVIQMVEKIALRQGLGDILAEGPLRAAEKIGRDSEKYLIHIKGMSNLHSDERPTPSLALGIATASRGADHLRSRPAIDLYHLPVSVLEQIYKSPTPYEGHISADYTSYEGKARQVQWHEMCYMAVDSLGICKFHTIFLSPNLLNFEHFSKFIYYITGLEIPPIKIWQIADRAYTLERMFNIREGLKREYDWLPDRYFNEPTPLGLPVARNKKIDPQKFKQIIDEYYQLHGWDENGFPTPQTLKELQLDKEPSYKL